jgi:hypothetical protein
VILTRAPATGLPLASVTLPATVPVEMLWAAAVDTKTDREKAMLNSQR